jgi:hypothetical protein
MDFPWTSILDDMMTIKAEPQISMAVMLRPRRSLLFMPGSNPLALKKARELAADGFILDLEDAVALEAKESARSLVAAALAEGGYGGRELVLRVNALDTAGRPSGAPSASSSDTVSRTRSAVSTFGSSTASIGIVAAAARSAWPQAVSRALTRNTSSRPP